MLAMITSKDDATIERHPNKNRLTTDQTNPLRATFEHTPLMLRNEKLQLKTLAFRKARSDFAHRLRRTGRVGIEMSQQLAVLANDQPVSVHRGYLQ